MRPEKRRPIQITLDGYPGATNVGVLMAQKLKYFEEAGLEVVITTPIAPARPIVYAADKTVDLSISHPPQVALARQKGAPIVAIAAIVPQSTASMIWLRQSKIDDLTDLKGKTIGVPGSPFQRAFLESVIADAGLNPQDVRIETLDYELVPALVSGRVDATFGGSWNLEGAELDSRGLDPVITKAQDLGVPDYEELVLIARSDRLSKDPDAIRAFIAAMLHGTEAALEDPRAAASVIRNSIDADPDLTYKESMAELEATLPLLSTDGEMDADQAEELVDWMQEEGMIEQAMPASDLLTNDYLASP